MNWIDKLERRFGRFAVNNLMLYLIICYAMGFLIIMTNPGFYEQYLSLNMQAIFHGQVWRLLTFVIYPPSTQVIWLLLLSYIYYSIGRLLEQMWGTFRFNLYVLLGIFGHILAALIIYLIWGQVYLLTADNLYMSMLLGVAITIPETRFYLYFVIPVKAKWLGYIYVAIIFAELVLSSWPGRITIVLSLLNVILFFALIRKPVQQAKVIRRRKEFARKMESSQPKMGPRHRCAVCGKTEQDDPDMEFRFCSKCDGNYEYCKDHLYTHVHVTGDTNNNN